MTQFIGKYIHPHIFISLWIIAIARHALKYANIIDENHFKMPPANWIEYTRVFGTNRFYSGKSFLPAQKPEVKNFLRASSYISPDSYLNHHSTARWYMKCDFQPSLQWHKIKLLNVENRVKSGNIDPVYSLGECFSAFSSGVFSIPNMCARKVFWNKHKWVCNTHHWCVSIIKFGREIDKN